jgi:hypothetical protein
MYVLFYHLSSREPAKSWASASQCDFAKTGAAFAAEFDFLSVKNTLLPLLACALPLLVHIGGDFCFSRSSPVLEPFLAIALGLAADSCASTLLLGLLLLPSSALSRARRSRHAVQGCAREHITLLLRTPHP